MVYDFGVEILQVRAIVWFMVGDSRRVDGYGFRDKIVTITVPESRLELFSSKTTCM